MLKVGHRGAAGHEPENTLRSFRRAISLGVDMVECDVYRCKSGEPVVIHDSTVDRTTNGRGKVHDLTLEELKKLSISGTETIPTLQEVIDLCRGKILINVEIKDSEDAEAALEIIKKNDAFSWVMISSNYLHPLTFAHKLDEKLQTALIFYSTKTDARDLFFALACLLVLPFTIYMIKRRAKKSGAKWVNLMKQLTNHYTVKVLKKMGLKVGVWTPNTKDEIKKYTGIGVDAIITNFPDRF